MIQKSQSSLLIFTPYFNLPKPLKKDIIKALKRGVKITLVIGDKTANDFYIPEEKKYIIPDRNEYRIGEAPFNVLGNYGIFINKVPL